MKFFLSILTLIYVSSFVFPQDLSFLPQDKKEILLKEKKILEISSKHSLNYLPPFMEDKKKQEITSEIQKISPNIVIEGLFLIPKSKNLSLLYFYNSLLRVSAFSEIFYYNEDKKVDHPLFGFSYAIKDLNSKEKIPDPIANHLIPHKEIWVYQNFLPESLATSLYRYDCLEDEIFFKSVNLDAVKYQGFTASQKEKLVNHIWIKELDNTYVIYFASYGKVTSFFGKIQRLFSFRLKGFINWYYTKYLKNYIKS